MTRERGYLAITGIVILAVLLLPGCVKDRAGDAETEVVPEDLSDSDTEISKPVEKVAAWKTYKNGELGLSFKYPADSEIKFDSGVVFRFTNKSAGLSVALMVGDAPNMPLDAIAPMLKTKFDATYETSGTFTETKLGGTAAKLYSAVIRKDGENLDMRVYIVEHGEQVLMLVFTNQSSANRLRDKIVESVKFAKPVEKEIEWTEYKNEELGLSFKYPADFEVDPDSDQLFRVSGKGGAFQFVLEEITTGAGSIESAAAARKERLDSTYAVSGTIADVELGGKEAKLYSCTTGEDIKLDVHVYIFECGERILKLFFVSMQGLLDLQEKIVKSVELFEPAKKQIEWTTFKSDDLGLSFKYPADFEVDPDSDCLIEVSGMSDAFKFGLKDIITEAGSIESAAAAQKELLDETFSVSSTITDVELGRIEAKLYSCTVTKENGDLDVRIFIFEHGARILKYFFVNLRALSKLREKIVGSFEFWPVWPIFTSGCLDLSFKYPPEFEVKDTRVPGTYFEAEGFDESFNMALWSVETDESNIEAVIADLKESFDLWLNTSGTVTDYSLGGKRVKLYSCTASDEGKQWATFVYVFKCSDEIITFTIAHVPEYWETRGKIVDSFKFHED